MRLERSLHISFSYFERSKPSFFLLAYSWKGPLGTQDNYVQDKHLWPLTSAHITFCVCVCLGGHTQWSSKGFSGSVLRIDP